MSFDKAFLSKSNSPETKGETLSSSSKPSFLLPSFSNSAPVASVSLSNSTVSSDSKTTKSNDSNLIGFLESLETSKSTDSSPSKNNSSPVATNFGTSFSAGSPKPKTLTLDNFLSNANSSSLLNGSKDRKQQEQQLISAMTYNDGQLLNEADSSSSDDDEDIDDDEKISSIVEDSSTSKDSVQKEVINSITTQDSSLHQEIVMQLEKSYDNEKPEAKNIVDANEVYDAQRTENASIIQEGKSDKSTTSETIEQKNKYETPEPEASSKETVEPLVADEIGSPGNDTESTSNTLPQVDPENTAEQKKSVSFDFQKFLKQFKNKQCEPVHRYLKSFLIQFAQKNWSVDEQTKLVKDFQIFIFGKLISYPPFNQMTEDDEFDNCKEGLEKLIMSRIYNQVFAPATPERKMTPSHKEDLKKDKKFYENVRLFDWITLKHLDVPIEIDPESTFLKLASNELTKINEYKSPRDKIICLLNCCKVIFGLIRQQKKQHKLEENADSFVPILIYVILQAKPKYLPTNVSYIERFRSSEFLVGETSYYISTLQIATNFISTIDKSLLTITDEEYENNLNANKERLKKEIEEKIRQRRLQKQQMEKEQAEALSPIPKKLTDMINQNLGSTGNNSPSMVLKNSAEMLQQSFTNFFNQPPTQEEQQREQIQNEQNEAANNIKNIKKLSLQENERHLQHEKKKEEAFKNIKEMFPGLDDELLQDVVISKEGDVAQCIDACLELSG
ncbi:hypothetical protein B5S28_g2507 [[Candida] boidinii]|nr:hypothetical protein B5S28_g2507 [[Candida] boidinii]